MDMYEAWSEAYLKNCQDPHKVFSEILGITRSEAKRLCYQLMWDSEFIRAYVRNQNNA